jgi:hypothetical protein
LTILRIRINLFLKLRREDKVMIIEIDDEVSSYILSKVVHDVDKTLNDTIRRLLGFDKAGVTSTLKSLPQRRPQIVEGRRRKPWADLKKLVNSGDLKEGQILHLRNFQRLRVPDSEATIYQGALLKDGITYSMSKLALKLFEEKEGYKPNSVSGPVYWYTDNNVSIKNLWDDYLEKNGWDYNS